MNDPAPEIPEEIKEEVKEEVSQESPGERLYRRWSALFSRHDTFFLPRTRVAFSGLGEGSRAAWEGLARELEAPGSGASPQSGESREMKVGEEHPFGARGHSLSVACLIEILRKAPPEMKVVLRDQEKGYLFSPSPSVFEPLHDSENRLRKTDASFYGEKVLLLDERIRQV